MEMSKPSSKGIVPGSRRASTGTRRPSLTRGSKRSRSHGRSPAAISEGSTFDIECGRNVHLGRTVGRPHGDGWSPPQAAAHIISALALLLFGLGLALIA